MTIHTFKTEDEFLSKMDGKIYAIERELPNFKKVYLCDVEESTLVSLQDNGYISKTEPHYCSNYCANFVFDNRVEIVIKGNV